MHVQVEDLRPAVAPGVDDGPEAVEHAEPAHEALLGRMMGLAPRLMKELGVTNGYRHLINTGADGRQEVPHVHLHVMGGPRPWSKG